MNGIQKRVLQCQRRVQAWCAANPGLIPPPVGSADTWSPITKQFDALNKVVEITNAAAADQLVSATQITLEATDELGLRAHLRREMRWVTQVAQALRKTVPGISVLKMPSPKVQVEGLLKAADAFITQASTYEAVLVEHALPADFIQQLRDAAATVRASVDGRGAARASQVSATKVLADGLSQGSKLVQILDSAIKKAIRTDSAKLAEWENVKRVTIKGVNTGDDSTSPFTVPTPGTAPATPPVSVTQPAVQAA